MILISLLLGNFFATAISATAGQAAKLDVTIAAFLLLLVESISWLYYRFTPRRQQAANINEQLVAPNATPPSLLDPSSVIPTGLDVGPVRSRSTLAESLNAFKLGLIYGLFVEAFKLGS